MDVSFSRMTKRQRGKQADRQRQTDRQSQAVHSQSSSLFVMPFSVTVVAMAEI